MKWSVTSPTSIVSDDGQYTIGAFYTSRGKSLSAVYTGGKQPERVAIIDDLPTDKTPEARASRLAAEADIKAQCEQHRIRQQTKGSGWSIYRRAAT